MLVTHTVSIKAFGDLVIASRFLRTGSTPVRILAGEHLRPLVLALGLQSHVDMIDLGPRYPAAFDVRGQGTAAALRSLFELRKAFRRLPRDWCLLWDHFDSRERFIGAAHKNTDLLPAPNVYLAFEATLRSSEPATVTPPLDSNAGRSKITIVPSSRVAAKRIPLPVLTAALSHLQAYGECEIIDMPGEEMELPRNARINRIERSFPALLAALHGSRLIVSADSLSSHLAEFLGIPCYVITPRPNEYWLPLQAFKSHAWSTFKQSDHLPDWLKRRFAVG
jgi:ADP-heptose:LPS heptosyltransferase